MNKFYITNGVTHDGFGGRAQRLFSIIALTYYLKYEHNLPVEFIYTPFNHDKDDDFIIGEQLRRCVPEYPYNDIDYVGYMNRAKLWDEKLNFLGNKINNINPSNSKYGYETLINDIRTNTVSNNLYTINVLHNEYDTKLLDINIINKYRDDILSNFGFKIKENDKIEIALHIRRKDATPLNGRYLDDEYYLNVLNYISNLDDNYNITIYTQKIGFDESKYSNYKIVYDDIENDYDTFINLISANHLIVGKSSFSYSAALLNNNVVVYHYNGHIPMNNWMNITEYLNLVSKYVKD